MSRYRNSYCGVADVGCLNPPAYATQVGSMDNPDPPRTRAVCAECGDTACAECRSRRKGDGFWVCHLCAPEAQS